jgi:uncharacterized membrane protein YoaK (UPF0700 family)
MSFIGRDSIHGPLPFILLLLTAVTGIVDAVSYLGLGQVFVANMTGNVVFLGFAIGGAQGFSIQASILAIACFLVGALVCGCIGSVQKHRGRLLFLVVLLETLLIGSVPAAITAHLITGQDAIRYGAIAVLSFAMGMQNAAARRFAVPDLTTTVLTLTLTGIAADSRLAGGNDRNLALRLMAVAAMLSGATIGAILVLRAGMIVALMGALAMLVVTTIIGLFHWSASAPWTAERK